VIGIFGNAVPYELKALMYAISLTVKSLIIFVLPWVILGLLFKVSSEMAHKATKMIILVLLGICASNFATSLIGGYIGYTIYNFDYNITQPTNTLAQLEPIFHFSLPKIIPNDFAMLIGLIGGVCLGRIAPGWAKHISGFFDKAIKVTLSGMQYIIPFFVAGFLIKLKHEGLVMNIVENYSLIFMTIAIVAAIYLGLLYYFTARLDIQTFLGYMKNMLPACVVGFSTMSSAAAMPLMIDGAAKSSPYPEVARSVVPMGVNFHLIGCSISIPIMVFAILKHSGFAEPSLASYLVFAGYFVVAKFSVAAVPGGGVIVMLPIIESCFGFNSDMLSLITALYIMFDPVITTCNILGNGYFAVAMSKISGHLLPK
jgi:hypothetical protein